MLDKRLNDKGKNWRHVFKVSSTSPFSLHPLSTFELTAVPLASQRPSPCLTTACTLAPRTSSSTLRTTSTSSSLSPFAFVQQRARGDELVPSPARADLCRTSFITERSRSLCISMISTRTWVRTSDRSTSPPFDRVVLDASSLFPSVTQHQAHCVSFLPSFPHVGLRTSLTCSRMRTDFDRSGGREELCRIEWPAFRGGRETRTTRTSTGRSQRP
jgi:hypothetical protein